MSISLLVVVVSLYSSRVVDSNPVQNQMRNEMRRLLNDKLDKVDMSNEETVYDLFEEWASAHDLTFTDDNDRMDALLKWKTNAINIKKHRGEHKQGKHTYTLGLNQFAHKTVEELRRTRLGYKNPSAGSAASAAKTVKKNKKVKRVATPLPTSVNWVTAGLVTAVKDQGDCGSCWTFSTAAVLESAYKKKGGALTDFSEEEFVDCTAPYIGCDGGVPAHAVEFVAKQGGIATAASYPYVAQNMVFNSQCKLSSAVKIPMTPTYTWLDDDAALQAAVAYQPASAAIAVGEPMWYYESGVLDSVTACDTAVNHAIVVVGYGVDAASGLPYWLIRNSWSASWGENGYMRISRSVSNACLINTDALSVQLP